MDTHINRIFDIFLNTYKKKPNYQSFNYKENNTWKYLSISDFIEIGNQLSSYFIKKNIIKGDKIGLISTSRWEWHLIDFAISQIGAINVPLYTSLSGGEYKKILDEVELKIIFTSNVNLYNIISDVIKQSSLKLEIISIDEIPNAINYKNLLIKNYDINEIIIRRENVFTDDLATIIYTSGTEGNSKGVMLSNKNIISNLFAIDEALEVDENDIALTFLPLNHIYEKTVSLFFIYKQCKLFYAESMVKVIDNAKEISPTIFTCIPLLIKKIYEKIIEKGSNLKGIKKIIFNWSINIANNWDNEKPESLIYKLQRLILDKLVYQKWRKALGGKVRIIASGSAALNPIYIKAFQCAKINLLEGYGLTETSPVVAVNRVNKHNLKLGTVGALLNKVEAKIALDGEILIKGPNVMMGYYKNPEKTKEVLSEDGWFSTGDIGIIIDNKFLKITDRKKEIFKTSGGKYISPQSIESKLKEFVFIENLIVFGENQDVVATIIQPNWELLKKWCSDNNIEYKNNEQIIANNNIIKLYKGFIDNVNKDLVTYEQIRRFKLISDAWSINTGELTPTLKLKRKIIEKKYKNLIEEIFA